MGPQIRVLTNYETKKGLLFKINICGWKSKDLGFFLFLSKIYCTKVSRYFDFDTVMLICSESWLRSEKRPQGLLFKSQTISFLCICSRLKCDRTIKAYSQAKVRWFACSRKSAMVLIRFIKAKILFPSGVWSFCMLRDKPIRIKYIQI